jgi:hypothetical protein
MTVVDSKEAPVIGDRTDTEYNAHKLHCTQDFATSPSTKCLIIYIAKGLKLKKETGVTAKDALKAVGKMWEEPVPVGMVPDLIVKKYGDKNLSVSWSALYCERSGWTGWEIGFAFGGGKRELAQEFNRI